MKPIIASLVCCIFCVLGFSQSYEEVATQMGITFTYSGGTYGTGLSCVDYNQDGLDDLTISGGAAGLKFYKNNGNGFTPETFLGDVPGIAKSVTWVDFDNDDDLDLFIASREGDFSLFENQSGEYVNIFPTSGLPSTNDLTYGNSWGDYDNDGFLDVYICNYDSDGTTNYLFKNLGDGTFEDVTVEAGVGNGSIYSFQGLWIDYDEDGWQDLYVINDRESASNYMYHNNGDGTFEDVTYNLGFQDFFFSMCNTGADYDNDGDVDFFVTNNPYGHRLYRNEDGFFTDVAAVLGLATYDHCWGTVWMDYDNNGWQDLYVACSPFWGEPGSDRFYVSHDEATVFIEESQVGISDPGSSTHSVGAGDFNNDGVFDLFAVDDFPDMSRLFLSSPGENNYLKFTLKGVISNRDGVGAKVTCWTNGFKQTRYTFCGESYITQHSRSEIFGLGTAQGVDSLTIRWPSGIEDFYADLAINQTFEFVEGEAIMPTITVDGQDIICSGDSVMAFANGTLQNVQWNQGTQGHEIWITDAGSYSYMATTNGGAMVQSDTLVVEIWELPATDLEANFPSCYGYDDGSLMLTTTNQVVLDSAIWSSGSTSLTAQNLTSGFYTYVAYYGDGCRYPGNITLTQPDSLILSASSIDLTCFGQSNGSIVPEISGGTEPYDIDVTGDQFEDLAPGEYTLTVTDENGCTDSQGVSVQSPPLLVIDLQLEHVSCYEGNNGTVMASPNGGTPPYVVDFLGNDPLNLSAGEHVVLVVDSAGCENEAYFDINQPEDLEYEITVLPSSGLSDGSASIFLTGATPPYEVEWGDGTDELEVSDLAFGEHIVVVTDSEGCEWELTFWVDIVGIDEFLDSKVTVYPNPFGEHIRIKSDVQLEAIRLYDIRGREVQIEVVMHTNEVYISLPKDLRGGLYNLVCTDSTGQIHITRLTRLLE